MDSGNIFLVYFVGLFICIVFVGFLRADPTNTTRDNDALATWGIMMAIGWPIMAIAAGIMLAGSIPYGLGKLIGVLRHGRG